MSSIVQAFSKLNISITDAMISQMENLVIGFEIRSGHAIALNSQSLGVHPIAFVDSDRHAIFAIFHTSETKLREAIHAAPNINITYKVTSDAFNLLCVWLLHLSVIYIADEKVRFRFQLNVAKYLHYRYFTSLVNHNFPHGAVDGIMTAVINSLTRKSDIVIYGTWRKVIEARCTDLIDKTSIHYNVIQTATPDSKVLYILSDTQSRLRDKINLICEVYYQYHKQGISINSKSATSTDLEGEKILITKNSVFDNTISNMTIMVLNVHLFVDSTAANEVASQFQAISPSMLCAILTEWSVLATEQTKTNLLDYVEKTNDGDLYIGVRALIATIIQTSFRYCINNRVVLSNKAQVWVQLKNMYSSSRIITPEIIAIKNSVGYFVDSIGRTSRESTKSSLRLALIMYVIYRSFKYL